MLPSGGRLSGLDNVRAYTRSHIYTQYSLYDVVSVALSIDIFKDMQLLLQESVERHWLVRVTLESFFFFFVALLADTHCYR